MPYPHLLLLHGALGSSSQFAPLLPFLESHFTLHTLDFDGHGASPLPDGRPFDMDTFVSNALTYLQSHNIEQVHIFGYSMGGYVACKLALSHPALVSHIATLGTKYIWSPEVAARETAFLDPEKIAAKVPKFAQALAARHAATGWQTVVQRTATMLNSVGQTGGFTPDLLAQLNIPVRVIVGDRDITVSVTEAAEVYRSLPQGELEVLPATRHEFERLSPERLARSLVEFFSCA
jgi:pimeloyl-ACP methyl ester carboxylesterase